jgi:integrase
MTRKRGNNEGSLHKRSSGSWRAQISLDQGRIGFTAKTKTEAIDWLQKMRLEADRGLTYRAAKMTYEEYLGEWLKTAESRLTYETFRSYRQLSVDYLIPSLGKKAIREITPLQIQRLYNNLIERKIGKRTIQKTHAVIRASLNSAKKMGLISSNPGNAIKPPKPDERPMLILDQDQVKNLLRYAKESGNKNFCLFYLAFVSGMRQGELLALKWSEVDLSSAIVNVKFSLKRIPEKGLVPMKPKTKSSIRAIQIASDGVGVLKSQYENVEGMKAGNNWVNHNYVFPSSAGQALEPAEVYRDFQRLLKQVGLPKMRFHDIRHTAASLMLHNGIDVLVVSRRLGHAKPSITLDFYGHLLPAIQTEAAKVIEKLLKVD